MSFPFPDSPVDGQVVTHTQRDGTVLKATYDAALNQWTIDRGLPPPTPVTSATPIQVTPTADRQVITWDDKLKTWVAAASHIPKLQELSDVVQSDSPHLGTMPIWQYAAGSDQKSGKFNYATPPAHIKNWEAVVHWESGAAVYHKGLVWRATKNSSNVEPAIENGRVQLYIHVPGEPTFGIIPTDVSSSPPPTGHQAQIFKLGYWLQYTNDTTMTVWKWVIKGLDPATRHPYGEWEGRPWQCMAWRSLNPPPNTVPPGTVVVWIHGESTSTVHPIKGQQDWATLELTHYLSQAADTNISTPKHGDLMTYNAVTHKWDLITRADLAAALAALTAPHTHP